MGTAYVSKKTDDFSPRRPWYALRAVYVGFMVEKVALWQFSLRVLRFPLSVSFHRFPIFTHISSIGQPNVVVDLLTLLLRIREVPGLNLGPKPAILTDFLRGFPQLIQAIARIVP
jgi:hypothetical protein